MASNKPRIYGKFSVDKSTSTKLPDAYHSLYSRKLPTYAGGGFFKKTGQFLGNAARYLADDPLTMLGLEDVIADEDYKGVGSNLFRTAGIASNLKAQVAPAILNLAAPGAGSVLQAGQSVLGGLDEAPIEPQADPYLGILQQLLGTQQQKVATSTNTSTFSGTGRAVSYAPTFAFGGNLPVMQSIKGNTHENGGVPVDSLGNPSIVSKQEPIAEVEGEEEIYDGYVFSDKLEYEE